MVEYKQKSSSLRGRLSANLRGLLPHNLRGDSLVEVMFAVGIFGMVAVGAIQIMNRGLYTAQDTLEHTMAMNEMNSQAESLRFIHEAYVNSEELSGENAYNSIWRESIKSKMYNTEEYEFSKFQEFQEIYDLISRGGGEYKGETYYTCDDLYKVLPENAFVIDPSLLSESSVSDALKDNTMLQPSAISPRLFRGDSSSLTDASVITGDTADTGALASADGIWVLGVASTSGIYCDVDVPGDGKDFRPDYYDFYIQTCWDTVGSGAPATTSTTIRIFNPDQIKYLTDLNVSYSTDVAILLDKTGSMGGVIARYTEDAINAGNAVFAAGGRLAVYDYGDAWFLRCGFDTCDPDSFVAALNHASEDGGGDAPEATAATALDALLNQDWTSGGAIIIMTDVNYHESGTVNGVAYTNLTDEVIRVAQEKGVQIFVLVNAGSASAYNRLTEETGGAIYHDTVSGVFTEIVDSLTPKIATDCQRTPEPEPTPVPEINYYTIYFNGNGADNASLAVAKDPATGEYTGSIMAPMTGVYGGEAFTLRNNEFTRAGYTFAGWSTSPTGSGGRAFNDNGTVSDTLLGLTGEEEITLYAKWEESAAGDKCEPGIPAIQDWTNDALANPGDTITLCDLRDGTNYNVVRLTD